MIDLLLLFQRHRKKDQALLEHTQEPQESFNPNLKPSSTIEYESHGVYIESPAVLTLAGDQVNNLVRGRTYRYTYNVFFTQSASNVRFGMLIKTISGLELGVVHQQVPPEMLSPTLMLDRLIESNSASVVP